MGHIIRVVFAVYAGLERRQDNSTPAATLYISAECLQMMSGATGRYTYRPERRP